MSRPRRPAHTEAYRRALLLPVQPWKRQWVTPVGGSPGLKVMKWVKSDEKLQWSDDEDDGALEHALGVVEADQDQDGDALGGDDDLDGPDEGQITPLDAPGSFPPSGVGTPTKDGGKPHPLSREVKGGEDDDDDEGEDGEGEEGEEGEEDDEGDDGEEGEEGEIDEDEDMEEDAEYGEVDGEERYGEGEGEGEEQYADGVGDEDGGRDGVDEDVDDDLMPPTGYGGETGGYDGDGGAYVGDVSEMDESGMLENGLGGTDFVGHLPDLSEVAQKSLLEGESTFDHPGAIEEALGQQTVPLVNADDPNDVFM